MTAVRTDRTGCGTCGARTIDARLPGGRRIALNYTRDPQGGFAVTHQASGAWTARPMSQAEMARPLLPPQHRHSVHDCSQVAEPP